MCKATGPAVFVCGSGMLWVGFHGRSGVLMFFDVLARIVELFNRYFKLALCTALAGALVWRGNTFIEPHTGAILAPFMCVVTATVLIFTGLGLTFDDRKPDTGN